MSDRPTLLDADLALLLAGTAYDAAIAHVIHDRGGRLVAIGPAVDGGWARADTIRPVTEPDRPPSDDLAPPTVRDVDYKGAPLDSEKGPGLGCFWTQVAVLGILLVLTPLSVAWGWPFWVSATLLVVVLVLLLLAGQTVIFLLRLVAADRRAAGRRRPLASTSPTVGELEDAASAPASAADAPENAPPGDATDTPEAPGGGVRE